jgi:hypothetical protein
MAVLRVKAHNAPAPKTHLQPVDEKIDLILRLRSSIKS